jgi:methylated-DNA-protein-cysteine methyltransferase-like protein
VPSRDTEAQHIDGLYRSIYRVIRRIPRGTVATYGQVAELAGIPRGGRVVGYALRVSGAGRGLPWHRVVGKKSRNTARIAILDPVGGAMQRRLLVREGVDVTETGGISLNHFGWLPLDIVPGAHRKRERRAGRRAAP